MLVTSEYTTLNLSDGSKVVIKPNQEFQPIEGEFIATSFARITDLTNGQTIDVLPGVKTKGLGEVQKPVKPKRPRAKAE